MKSYMHRVNGRDFQLLDRPGEKAMIIGIHGLTGNHKNLHYYSEALAGEYRFISLDLRGRGNSSETEADTSIEHHADDVIALLESLQIEEPILLGHSMGGFIAALVASRLKQTKALILLDGAAKASEHQRQIVKPSLTRLSKRFESVESYVLETKAIYNRLGVEWTDVIQKNAEYEIRPFEGGWKHKSDPEQILKDFESFYAFDSKEVCSRIHCDTLLVMAKGGIGPYPPLFFEKDFEDTKEHTKSINTFISDCNHYTMVFQDQPEINETIRAFLSK